MEDTSVKKPVRAIQDYQKKRGFNLVELISEDDKEIIAAFGYTNRTYSELKRYNKNSKRLDTLFVDGENPFSAFVARAKSKYTKE